MEHIGQIPVCASVGVARRPARAGTSSTIFLRGRHTFVGGSTLAHPIGGLGEPKHSRFAKLAVMHGRTTIFSAGEPLLVRPGGRFEPTSPPGRWAARSPSLKTRHCAFRRPSAGERMIAIWTNAGTIIVFDPEVGTASGRSEHEAWKEIERRKAMKQERRAVLQC